MTENHSCLQSDSVIKLNAGYLFLTKVLYLSSAETETVIHKKKEKKNT